MTKAETQTNNLNVLCTFINTVERAKVSSVVIDIADSSLTDELPECVGERCFSKALHITSLSSVFSLKGGQKSQRAGG